MYKCGVEVGERICCEINDICWKHQIYLTFLGLKYETASLWAQMNGFLSNFVEK